MLHCMGGTMANELHYHCLCEYEIVQEFSHEPWASEDNTLHNVEVDMAEDRLVDLFKKPFHSLR